MWSSRGSFGESKCALGFDWTQVVEKLIEFSHEDGTRQRLELTSRKMQSCDLEG
jgi:hypothetical protein